MALLLLDQSEDTQPKERPQYRSPRKEFSSAVERMRASCVQAVSPRKEIGASFRTGQVMAAKHGTVHCNDKVY